MVELETGDILNRWIPERLRAWSFPDCFEQDSIADTVAVTETAIRATASQISAGDGSLEELKRQQEMLELRLAGCKSLLSPIRKLPKDILLEIFRLCANFQTRIAVQTNWRGTNDQTVISWERSGRSLPPVCSAWNTLIVSTASFWSKIFVYFDCQQVSAPSAESSAAIQGILGLALERSQEAPLDIEIVVWTAWPLASTMIRPLLQEVHRWKHLDLSLHQSRQFADRGFNSFTSCLSTLETLSITTIKSAELNPDFLTDMEGTEGVGRSNWFSSVPRLRELVYNDIPINFFDIPWSQLQKLVLTNYRCPLPVPCVEALELATSVRSLSFRIGPCEMAPRDHIQLCSITSLDICTEDMPFIGMFTFPHLTELALQVHQYDSGVSTFLSQVSRDLQCLDFKDYAAELFPFAFFNSNLCFPELIKLSVAMYSGEWPEQEAHFIAAASERFPKLSSFSCNTFMKPVYEHWLAVFTWLKSSISPSSLRSIEILFSFRFHIPDDCTLRDLTSKVTKATVTLRFGMKIKVEDYLELDEEEREAAQLTVYHSD